MTDITNQDIIPNISVDCVIFGFHENELKVFLLNYTGTNLWALPGGFIEKNKTIEEAGADILKERIGLENIFLKQFDVFSNPERSKHAPEILELIKKIGRYDVSVFQSRFISIGLYALLDHTKVTTTLDRYSDKSKWVAIDKVKNTILDHKEIINTALKTLRLQISYTPIGYNLLPQKFTMPEMQSLYETILGKKLDRRNFQRKMNAYNILNKLDEKREGVAHKAPFLYEFNQENYKEALKNGFNNSW
ncbi:NUDIX hydrolase [Carboxylicivirga caseinilyticus]|uniref:NUDIX hydrolase n=1 Tax=Carboxylicivirga caseinilyticus TaxID=3417572 RepID=UPI003D355399|nr:NUDIX hydrolase [Marinilabiliaceae bacterium A049]